MNVTLKVGKDKVITTAILSKKDAQDLIESNSKQRKSRSRKKTTDATEFTPESVRTRVCLSICVHV